MALRDAVKEGDGKTSYTRLAGFLIILVNLVAGLLSAWKGQGMGDIPWGWTILVGGLYGWNVTEKIGKTVRSGKPDA